MLFLCINILCRYSVDFGESSVTMKYPSVIKKEKQTQTLGRKYFCSIGSSFRPKLFFNQKVSNSILTYFQHKLEKIHRRYPLEGGSIKLINFIDLRTHIQCVSLPDIFLSKIRCTPFIYARKTFKFILY